MKATLIEHLDEPFDGPMNMAIDQAIAESVDVNAVPCLRLYRWNKPTLSLGYFQSAADITLHPSVGDLPWVRRSTGGGAIVHDHELTYSLVMPSSRTQRGANRQVYDMVHSAIIHSVHSSMGIHLRRYRDSGAMLSGSDKAFLCFERRTDEDLVCSGYKVAGSAQRRVGSALLQHGSLLLHTSQATPSLPGLGAVTGFPISMADITAKLIAAISDAAGLSFAKSDVSQHQSVLAAKIANERFNSDGWNHRR